MGIFADDVAECFFKQGPLGLTRFQREVGELLANVFDATHVDLLEHLALLTLPGVSAIDVLRIPKSLALFFRRDRRAGLVSVRGVVNPKEDVDIFVAGGICVRVHIQIKLIENRSIKD